MMFTSLMVGALLLAGSAHAAEPVIGIFGDVHGSVEIAEKVLKAFQQYGVTHVIGTGDFVAGGGPTSLQNIVSMITPLTGVPPERVYLMPGNWEAETGYPIEKMLEILRAHGQLITPKYDHYGVVEIEGRKLMVSHFPQFSVPEELLPPAKFLRRPQSPLRTFVLDTIAREVAPPADVDAVIFGHTHIHGTFVEPKSGKTVINPGPLHPYVKAPTEPLSCALYYPNQEKVAFLDAATSQVYQAAEVRRGSGEPSLLKACYGLF